MRYVIIGVGKMQEIALVRIKWRLTFAYMLRSSDAFVGLPVILDHIRI